MDQLVWGLVLLAALAVLLKGADMFVEQAAQVAEALGVPHFVIGVTLVALGTSLPELAASLISVTQGAGEFVAGTVFGSNVANICLILGAAALVFKGVNLSRSLLTTDLPVMILAALVLGIISLDRRISLVEGALLLVMYGLYLCYCTRCGQLNSTGSKGRIGFKGVLLLLAGAAGVYFGAAYTVKAVVNLSAFLGLADTSVLALTIVAVGSSLPELVVTLTAAKKGLHDLSVGNVVGSNICNSFLVIGVPALIKPLPVSQSVFAVGLPFMLAASLGLFFFAWQGRLSRTGGMFLLLLFALFLATLTGIA